MIEIRLMKYFLAVAAEQNITKAAQSLHISQPTLSAQITELEKTLGLKLFKRTNKSTVLTEDGVLFRARVREIIELVERVENEFSIHESITGDVFLGCAETHIMAVVSRVMKEIQTEHPGIRFHVYSGDAQAILERLDKGLLDAGLLLGDDFRERYDYIPTGMYDTFGLLVPADSPIAGRKSIQPDELCSMPIILSAQTVSDSRMQGLVDMQKLNVAGTYNLITNATYMVEAGLGYALCLAELVNTDNRNLKFIPVDSEFRYYAYLVTKKHAYFSKPAKIVISKVREHNGRLHPNSQ